MNARELEIAGRRIGADAPPYVVAELSANHNGSLDRALAVIDAVVEAGADAIKLQTYTPDTITIDSDGPGFVIEGGPWAGRTLYDLYREAHTPWDWHAPLIERARRRNVPVFSTPFDATAVDFLERLGTPAYKIASFELTDLPLLRKVAATGKPVILSTGMADVGEMAESVATLRGAGCGPLLLLHCVSAYPAPPEECNLRTIRHMAEMFDLPVGLSDHTLGHEVAVAAVALGAVAVEKHVTLRRADGGPDSAFSLEPEEFGALVRGVRTAWQALGQVDYTRTPSERGNAMFRRSVYAVTAIRAGEVFSSQNLRVIRPGFGIAPRHFDDLIGRRARTDIAPGTPMAWAMVD